VSNPFVDFCLVVKNDGASFFFCAQNVAVLLIYVFRLAVFLFLLSLLKEKTSLFHADVFVHIKRLGILP
jgi:hypothetical protein